jgi:hypothetical protein
MRFNPGYSGRARLSSYNDDWLLEGSVEGRIALDPNHHVWLYFKRTYAQNMGIGRRDWNSTSGGITFEFNRWRIRSKLFCGNIKTIGDDVIAHL